MISDNFRLVQEAELYNPGLENIVPSIKKQLL